MGIDNKIELTQASGNFKKRYQRIRGTWFQNHPPILLKILPQNKVLKNNIKAKQECFA
ncbi:hypothetical protein HpCHC93_08840 [Helicobacter pylori]|nr:hypothetical protein VN0219_07910 [Helicobacter pylori]GHR98650.1 hypothetical protein VN0754_09060 [Helicobacter pylori]GHS03548.1 hypothetical protein VN0759_10300 [Helicobacter pylori]